MLATQPFQLPASQGKGALQNTGQDQEVWYHLDSCFSKCEPVLALE